MSFATTSGISAAAKDGPIDDALSAAINNGVVWGALAYNHVMLLAIMFLMVVKPATLGASLGVLVLAPAIGLWVGLSAKRPARSAAQPAVSGQS